MHGSMCGGVQVNKSGTSALQISTIDPDKFVIGFSGDNFLCAAFLGVQTWCNLLHKDELQMGSSAQQQQQQPQKDLNKNTKMPRFEILDQQQEVKIPILQ